MKKSLRILIIEDSEDDAVLMLHILGRDKREPIFKIVDREDELKLSLSADNWDAVLCDYHMPLLTCERCLELVRQKHPQIPFIIVSGFAKEAEVARLIQAGANGYVNKKNLDALIPTIESELGNRTEHSAGHS